jgi:hypothetical protein
VCGDLRADVRELRVRHENLEALVTEYARRLGAHVLDDAEVENRVNAIDLWRAKLEGARWGIVAAFTFLGSAAGALAGWLLGR